MPKNLALLTFLFLIAYVIIGPFLGIWAINTLFTLSIAFTLKNWIAAFVLAVLLGGSSLKIKTK